MVSAEPHENQMQITDVETGSSDSDPAVIAHLIWTHSSDELAAEVERALRYGADWRYDSHDREYGGRAADIAGGEYDAPCRIHAPEPGAIWWAAADKWVPPRRHQVDDIIAVDLDLVVVNNFAVFGETMSEMRDRIVRLLDDGVPIHVIDRDGDGDVVLDPGDRGVVDALLTGLESVGADLARPAREIVDSSVVDYSGGRPPVGFEVRGGDLVTGDDIEEVRDVLLRADVDVDDGGWSFRRAADELGCSPRTIKRAVTDDTRRELYGLDDGEEEE